MLDQDARTEVAPAPTGPDSPKRGRRSAGRFPLRRRRLIAHILQKTDARDRWVRRLQQFDALPSQLRRKRTEAGNITARVRQTRHDSDAKRFGDRRHDDWDRFGCPLGCLGSRRSSGDNQIDRQTN